MVSGITGIIVYGGNFKKGIETNQQENAKIADKSNIEEQTNTNLQENINKNHFCNILEIKH